MIAPKQPKLILPIIDEYCENYRDLFPESRTYGFFQAIHIGMLSEIKRKTLPGISKIVGLENEQGLHHFLTRSPWDVNQLKEKRIELILKHLRGRKIRVIFDETGDPKKGDKTDYVARQYIGRLGKIENGIVSVVAYGVIEEIAFPILFKVFKPKKRLKPGDIYKTKPEIASELVEELVKYGFEIEWVLSDSLYGESERNFVSKLEKLGLPYMLSIRSNHGVRLPDGERVTAKRWEKFQRNMSMKKTETRYVREIVFGRRGNRTYWEVTTDKETLPENATSFVMSNIPNLNPKDVGNIYGERTWIEYGFRQCKTELGWADFRLTHYADIEKWWELVCSVYLLVTLKTPPFVIRVESERSVGEKVLVESVNQHPHWDHQKTWKSALNNIRLLLVPWISFNAILYWLQVFPIPELSLGFPKIISLINRACLALFFHHEEVDYLFSSA